MVYVIIASTYITANTLIHPFEYENDKCYFSTLKSWWQIDNTFQQIVLVYVSVFLFSHCFYKHGNKNLQDTSTFKSHRKHISHRMQSNKSINQRPKQVRLMMEVVSQNIFELK